MADVSRTTITQMRPVAPVQPKGFLHSLFTDHPVAKLMALGLSTVLIILIHRELVEKLVDETILVTTSPVSNKDHLLITTQGGGFHVEVSRREVHVEVSGVVRKQTELPRPLVIVATIPAARLEGLGPNDQQREITLEPKDFSIRGLEDVEIKTSEEVVVTVRPFLVAKVRPVAEVVGLRPGLKPAVTFTPQEIEVVGPAHRIRDLGDTIRWSDLELPDGWAVGEPVTLNLDSLPEGLRKKGITLAEGQRITAAVLITASEDLDSVDVPRVAMVLVQPYPDRYEVRLKPPHDNGEDTVKLTGPRVVVEALKAAPKEIAEIARELRILIDVESVIDSKREELQRSEEGTDLLAPMRLHVPERVRAKYPALRLAEPLGESNVRITLRRAPGEGGESDSDK